MDGRTDEVRICVGGARDYVAYKDAPAYENMSFRILMYRISRPVPIKEMD